MQLYSRDQLAHALHSFMHKKLCSHITKYNSQTAFSSSNALLWLYSEFVWLCPDAVFHYTTWSRVATGTGVLISP